MSKLLVYKKYAYLNDEDRRRHGIVNGKLAETFEYKFTPPAELWRVVESNGSMLTEKFQTALDAFQMGGDRMVKIEGQLFGIPVLRVQDIL